MQSTLSAEALCYQITTYKAIYLKKQKVLLGKLHENLLILYQHNIALRDKKELGDGCCICVMCLVPL